MVRPLALQRPQSSPKGIITSRRAQGEWVSAGEGPGGGPGAGLYTDFSEYSGSGIWEEFWYANNSNWQIAEDEEFTGGKALNLNISTTNRVRARSWPEAGEPESIGFVSRMMSPHMSVNQMIMGVILRANGDAEAGTGTGYAFFLGDTRIYVYKIVNQDDSATINGNLLINYASFPGISGDWYMLKGEVDGDDFVRMKWWEDGDPEPSDWSAEVQDSTPLPAGKVGVISQRQFSTGPRYWDFLQLYTP